MKIYSVYDAEFKPYGQVVEGHDVQPLLNALASATPLPEGVVYTAREPALEALPAAGWMRDNAYGGMPVQLGWCNGHNTKLNCLEYHRDSEFNLGTEDFILLLAKQDEIENGKLDTGKVKAFRCPAGVLLEVFATSLHYAPCHTDPAKGFKVMIALPKGTNTARPTLTPVSSEDKLLWACNKCRLAHPSTTEAAHGALVGIVGENIDLQTEI